MLANSQVEDQTVADLRLKRGKAVWDTLHSSVGIWPACHVSPPPFGIWDGMGEYDPNAIQTLLKDALPKIAAERAWPWVARATFIYETERAIRDSYAPPEPNADILIKKIRRQADELWKSLIAINFLTIKSPEEVGRQHYDKAWQVQNAFQTHFGGPASMGVEYSKFLNSVQAVSRVCAENRDNVARNRKRGASDPHLSLLVLYLAEFWLAASGRKPSAADPFRADGKPGPFVRLVNGCLVIAGAPEVTAKQVEAAINAPPIFAASII